MAKHTMAYVVATLAMAGSLGAFGSAQTWADGCPTAESLAAAGRVSSEAELRYAITAADIAEVTIEDDFTISCTNVPGEDATYIAKDFTIDLNGKKITSNTPWALDIEGEGANGKTLTIKDTSGGGAFQFNDAGIWVDNGANLTIEAGDIRGTGGRGRGVSLMGGGKFTMNGGSVSGDPISYTNGGATYWYNLVQVAGEGSSAEINGGEIVVGSGEGRAFYSSAASTEMKGGRITSAGSYAVSMSGGVFAMSDGSVSSGEFGVVLFSGAEFTMSGGIVEAESIAISGNGTSTGDKITIGGGTIRSGELGIYAPQIEGITTITDGEIEAKTGVEVRAGTLNITGGRFIVDGEAEYEVVANGSGSTTTGAAVAVAQHTTKQPIDVNISGGVFIAPVAFSEANPQMNSEEDIAKIQLAITGGVFDGSIVSEDFDQADFMTGGDFGNWVESEGGEVEMQIRGAVVAESPISFSVVGVNKDELTLGESEDETVLVAAYDLNLMDGANVVTVSKGDGVEFEVTLKLTDEQYAALKDYDKVVIIYFEDGVEKERIEATLEQGEDGGWAVVFNTDHLSTYGVAGVNTAEENKEVAAPETGTMTAAGASAMAASLMTAIAVGILVSITSFAFLMRRR